MRDIISIGLLIAMASSTLHAAEVQLSQNNSYGLSSITINQINVLLQEKAARTSAQKKVNSALLYAVKRQRKDSLLAQIPKLQSSVTTAADGTILVDMKANVTDELLGHIQSIGGTVINSFPQYKSIRAKVPLDQVEGLAALSDVQSIRPADKFMLNKIDTSEGDVAHRASDARSAFTVAGSGIKIGVLSDSVDSLAALQASGDLPASVTVLTGQSGNPGTSEGTAMLEIVHDLAPGAQLFFATAFNGTSQFAQNILDLRAAGCNIIVDDVEYFNEGAFQDGIIAQAVNTVTADGALYFSSAGNSGNLNDGTSGVWEGDFPSDSPVQLFNGQPYDIITKRSKYYSLQWSDPLGASTNDYDLFLTDPSGNIIAFSTGYQNGSQDPYEGIDRNGYDDTGNYLVISLYDAAPRFMRLNTHRGQLQVATSGQIYGHSAAQDAFSVAAVYSGACGTGAPFCTTAPVETFSSDGPRKIFYNPDGTAITPGDFLSTGGTVRQKPDVAAADGVSTATPGFDLFYGTSAAAPHAAAIAALVLSANQVGAISPLPPLLTPAQVRQKLTSTTWDIEAPGVDRDSGAGILNAYAAVQAVIGTATIPGDVNGDDVVDINDVIAVINAVLGIHPLAAADVNSDGVVDINDVIFVINHVLGL